MGEGQSVNRSIGVASGTMAEMWNEWRAYLKEALKGRDKIWTKLLGRVETAIGVDRVNIVLGQFLTIHVHIYCSIILDPIVLCFHSLRHGRRSAVSI